MGTNSKPQEPTKPCKHCKLMIPKSAKVCPYCRKKQKHTALGIMLLVFGLIGLSVSCSRMLGDSETITNASIQNQAKVTESLNSENSIDNGYATLDKFNQIETNMAYEEVVDIMGSEGTIMSESEVMGIKSTMYYWYAENGIANMNIMVQNNKVVSKAQLGLE